jgi:hypothetical protein
MSSPTISIGYTWASGATVMPSRLNQATNSATINFTQTAVLAARVSAGAGVAEEVPFTSVGQAVCAAATQAAARSAIGAGTIASQAADAVSLTGGLAELDVYRAKNDSISYAGSVALDFSSAAKTTQTIALTGNLTITSSNLASGRAKFIRLTADASTRTLSFPAGWTFLNSTAPGSLPAGKTALLFLIAFGTTDSTVVASYAVQP